MYGSRAWDLNASFWQNVILNPAGQVAYMQTVRASNQSVDALLLRYLTFDKEFHPEEPAMPHLELPKRQVLRYADLARVLVLEATVAAVWRWRSAHRTVVRDVDDVASVLHVVSDAPRNQGSLRRLHVIASFRCSKSR
jgi:hypothetical protein